MSTPVLSVLEEDRHAWFAGRTRAIQKYLDMEVGTDHSRFERMVLDVGSGAGNMAHHLSHYGRVIGIDYNARPLAVNAQRGLEACQGFGDALPFADDSFDVVALLDTVEHIADELGVVAECSRVLKPGGRLLVTVPAFMWLWSYNDDINNHERRYTVAELTQKLELCGLSVRRSTYTSFFLFPMVAGIRLLRPHNPELASPHLTDDEEVYQVEMEPIPELMNTVLHGVGWLEAELLERWSLPFGVGIMAIAVKPTR